MDGNEREMEGMRKTREKDEWQRGGSKGRRKQRANGMVQQWNGGGDGTAAGRTADVGGHGSGVNRETEERREKKRKVTNGEWRRLNKRNTKAEKGKKGTSDAVTQSQMGS
jgi:hypothetical protein